VNKLNKPLSASASGKKKCMGVFLQCSQKFIGGGKLALFPQTTCCMPVWHAFGTYVVFLCKKEANDFFFVVYWL
jgi:hypothetical protein